MSSEGEKTEYKSVEEEGAATEFNADQTSDLDDLDPGNPEYLKVAESTKKEIGFLLMNAQRYTSELSKIDPMDSEWHKLMYQLKGTIELAESNREKLIGGLFR